MNAQRSLDWMQTRSHAETVRCPHCRAPVGTTCRNTHTGREITNFPAHPDRVKLANDRPPATHSAEIADLD